MKVYLRFKTPDVIDQLCLQDDEESHNFKEFLKKYIKWGEYLMVEFDNEQETVRVLGADE